MENVLTSVESTKLLIEVENVNVMLVMVDTTVSAQHVPPTSSFPTVSASLVLCTLNTMINRKLASAEEELPSSTDSARINVLKPTKCTQFSNRDVFAMMVWEESTASVRFVLLDLLTQSLKLAQLAALLLNNSKEEHVFVNQDSVVTFQANVLTAQPPQEVSSLMAIALCVPRTKSSSVALAAVPQAELSKMVHVSATVNPTNSLIPTDSVSLVPSTWSPRITNASASPATG